MELSECDYCSAEVEMMRADGELLAQNTLNKAWPDGSAAQTYE
jgi:hypothetical protein